MSSQVIIDNWSLQHASELLTGAVSHDVASIIAISGDSHQYDSVSGAAIQTEALFELLTLIILKDELLVDEKYLSTCESSDTPLLDLYRARLLRPVPFTEQEEQFSGLRAHLVDRLCVTSSLKDEQAENERTYAESRESANPLLAAVLWGGAGMLARSHYFRTPYSPHPQRRRLFVEAGALPGGSRAMNRLHDVVRSKRLEIFEAMASQDPFYSLLATLPPIPMQVIGESSSPSKFVETAIALRDEYRPLRAWLADAENAIAKGDIRSITQIEKTLTKIGTSGFRDFFSSASGVSVSTGFGGLRIPIGINPTAASNLFGVRAIMNRMVFGNSEDNALARYTQLMGLQGSPLEFQLMEHFGQSDHSSL